MKILIIDENATNLKILSLLLSKHNYEIKTVSSVESALDIVPSGIDLVLFDNKTGNFKSCKKLKNNDLYKKIPLIIFSGQPETDKIVEAFSCGADDYILIPFKPNDILSHVEIQLKLSDLKEKNNRDEINKILNLRMEKIFSSATLNQSKDDDTQNHLERVKRYSVILANELTKPIYKQNITPEFIKDLELAAPLHDIGKIWLPDNIIHNKGKLTTSEYEQMKQHTIIGYNMLKNISDNVGKSSFLEMTMNIVRYHHERYDGLGYPDNIAGSAIPLEARILAVADVYDALRTKKPYHEPISHEKSFEVIKGGRELEFDYLIVKALKKVHNEFDEVWNKFSD